MITCTKFIINKIILQATYWQYIILFIASFIAIRSIIKNDKINKIKIINRLLQILYIDITYNECNNKKWYDEIKN